MSSKNKKSNKKVFLVAQELKLARILAGNDKNTRDKALKSLKKWFQHRSNTLPFSEDDFLRIWKGLFYSMWMSDKPLIQEECAENIAKLIHFPTADMSMLFLKSGLDILGQQWFGIDQLRLDKFFMLIRRLLRQALIVLKNNKWKPGVIDQFNDIITKTILGVDVKIPPGLWLHFVEIFLEEVAKISEGKIKPDAMALLLKPFILALATANDTRKLQHLHKFIFTYLMRQSDLGLEYEDKYNAWKKQGFPGNINSMKKVQLSDDEKMSDSEEEKEISDGASKPLDPRAGRVNVNLPQLKFSAKVISNLLLEVKFVDGTNTKSRKMLTTLSEEFKKLASGTYPLGVQEIKLQKSEVDMNVRKAVNRLVKFEKKVNTKKEKPRKRKSSENISELTNKKQKLNDGSIKQNGNCVEEELDNIFNEPKNKKKNKEKKISNGKLESKNKKTAKRKLSHSIETPIKKSLKSDVEYMFVRNSGTWYVYDTAQSLNDQDMDESNPSLGQFISENLEEISSKQVNTTPLINNSPGNNSIFQETPIHGKHSPKNKNKSSSKNNKTPMLNNEKELRNKKSPKQNSSPKTEQTTPPADENDLNTSVKLSPIELFPKNEWDEPLQDGEYEICIPSKKHVKKLKKIGKQTKTDVNILINKSISSLRGKNRMSLDSKLIKNPFSLTPSSSKKVKINTKLNKSQDVEEHHAQLLSSPGIPYDANKKPSKPLLKRTTSFGGINPFYNKQLEI